MHIRTATRLDREAIRAVHLAAFAGNEREDVARIAVDLLAEETTPGIISLVAEDEGGVIGHVAFSPVSTDSDERLLGYILAPLGVLPACQEQRVGTRLVENGLRRLSAMGVDFVLVYGDPDYYGRFGFSADAAGRYIPPYELAYPFGWQGLVLDGDIADGPPVRIGCVPALCDPALW